jgi:hypothetical protein
MDIKYTNIFYFKNLQNVTKLGLKIHHLANLVLTYVHLLYEFLSPVL